MSDELFDAAGRRRSPAIVPGYRRGVPPRNKGVRYPADPPRVEEIIAVMRAAGPGVHGARVRALIVILWRAGLRIQEALALAETDLEPRRGSILRPPRQRPQTPRGWYRDWAWDTSSRGVISQRDADRTVSVRDRRTHPPPRLV